MKIATGIIVLLLCAAMAGAAERPSVSGAIAYTETVRFDYDKDGTKDNVQFWLEFKENPAVGTKGQPGYQPAGDALYYYLLDVDRNVKVTNWLIGFNMMSGPAPSGPYPLTDLVIEGNLARFKAFHMSWEVIDGGTGYASDTVKVDDGFKPKELKMYGGDLKISGP